MISENDESTQGESNPERATQEIVTHSQMTQSPSTVIVENRLGDEVGDAQDYEVAEATPSRFSLFPV